ncbi:unnamed protein product [Clonostachys rhizophaga]|uniref:Cytochrome P450 n=1 Tax=Clonostachys rhizophaga TaxID=160324 RepID=A0A9N9YLM2_9HYPO|nr:unnamed protein product [Clonostachys rhizophaga]
MEHSVFSNRSSGDHALLPPSIGWNWYHTAALLTTSIIIYATLPLLRSSKSNDSLPVANKLFPFEPSFFSRIRWALWAQQIIRDADKKTQGRPYKLARGDSELVVLPARLIPELNRYGVDVLDSRKSHAFTLLGHLTGVEVVEHTNYHVRMLQGSITPALPELFHSMAKRISDALKEEFPQIDQWTIMKPLPASVRCFSEGIALVLYGSKMVENPRLVELTYTLTRNVFVVAFAMRCVPSCLNRYLAWLLPAKWRMHQDWKALSDFVIPEVQRRKTVILEGKEEHSPDLITWMVQSGRTELERDPQVLATLCGSVAAGSTYSIANFVCRALSDLTSNPEVLEAVRAEILAKNAEIGGRWDTAALASLPCLESAMKETARLAPGTLIVYSRAVTQDCVIGGVPLKKGQFMTVSGPGRAMDPNIYEDPTTYKGLRFCADDKIKEHSVKPFRSVDTDILTWGAGKWACPGRYIADMAAKILLIQLIDAYEFSFVGGVPLKHDAIHEFLFFHPDNKMQVRRRKDAVGISL